MLSPFPSVVPRSYSMSCHSPGIRSHLLPSLPRRTWHSFIQGQAPGQCPPFLCATPPPVWTHSWYSPLQELLTQRMTEQSYITIANKITSNSCQGKRKNSSMAMNSNSRVQAWGCVLNPQTHESLSLGTAFYLYLRRHKPSDTGLPGAGAFSLPSWITSLGSGTLSHYIFIQGYREPLE